MFLLLEMTNKESLRLWALCFICLLIMEIYTLKLMQVNGVADLYLGFFNILYYYLYNENYNF